MKKMSLFLPLLFVFFSVQLVAMNSKKRKREEGQSSSKRIKLAVPAVASSAQDTMNFQLFQAVIQGNASLVNQLLISGARVVYIDINGNSSLHHAVVQGRADIVTLLLKEKAPINSINKDLKRPLYIAIQKKDPDLVKLLLESGASTSLKDNSGNNVLHFFVNLTCKLELLELDDIKIAKMLLDHQPSLCTEKNNDQCTPIVYADICNKKPLVVLFKWYAQQGKLDAHSLSYLSIVACYVGFDDILSQLLKKSRFIVNMKDKKGKSLLHTAVFYHCVPCVRLLLQAGVNVNAQDIVGRTVLHYAVLNENVEIVKLLLKAGTDSTIQTNNGFTAYDFLKYFGVKRHSVAILFQTDHDETVADVIRIIDGTKNRIKQLLDSHKNPKQPYNFRKR